MKVKKYVASSMPEAMRKIRTELGNDAVILNSKIVRSGGFLGLFKKNNIEVIAAVDHFPVKGKKPPVKANPGKTPVKLVPNTPVNGKIVQKSGTGTAVVHGRQPEDMVKEMAEIKSLVKTLSETRRPDAISYPGPIMEAARILNDQEVDQEIQDGLLAALLEQWYQSGSAATNAEVKEWLFKALTEKLSAYSFGEISFKKKFVNVVGPTGVGKTTTLAKIAADCMLKHGKKVAFITTDTYRIAAIDQLKTYAQILNVPLEVCYSMEDFRRAAQKFSELDLVLIDTAGRNFRNRQYVEDLRAVVDFERDMETFLVLSLTSKQRDMEQIFKQFSLIGIDRFIFTKADETSNYGAIGNMIINCETGAAYITNGQNVPDDIIPADAGIIAKTILGAELHEGSS